MENTMNEIVGFLSGCGSLVAYLLLVCISTFCAGFCGATLGAGATCRSNWHTQDKASWYGGWAGAAGGAVLSIYCIFTSGGFKAILAVGGLSALMLALGWGILLYCVLNPVPAKKPHLDADHNAFDEFAE
jgi:hypothetical protein